MEVGFDLELIEKIPFFRKLWPDDLKCILSYTTTHTLSYGDFLFKQGQAPDGLYVLLVGKLQVLIEEKQGLKPIIVREIMPGQYVGEFGVFDGKPRSASIKAQQVSKLLFLPAKAFEIMILTQPSIAKYVLGKLCELVIDQAHDKIQNKDTLSMIRDKNLRPDIKNMKILCEILRENNKSLLGIGVKSKGVLFSSNPY